MTKQIFIALILVIAILGFPMLAFGEMASGLFLDRNSSQTISNYPCPGSDTLMFEINEDASFGEDAIWNGNDSIEIQTTGYYLVTAGVLLESGFGKMQLMVNGVLDPDFCFECRSDWMVCGATWHQFNPGDVIQFANVSGESITIKNVPESRVAFCYLYRTDN